jgi:hypothetical protein
MGGALVAAGLLFTVLYPLWSTYAWVGLLEMGVFLIAGCVLLAAGLVRRRRGLRKS